MSQTLTRLLVHVVFSTKHRAPLIAPGVEEDLHKYLCGIARNHESPIIAIGGMPDHVHMLVSLSKKIALADLLQHLKGDSSRWIKSKNVPSFAWQDGYGAFTIGESQVQALTGYIGAQREHHRERSFQEELREILTRYGVAWDERYIWS